MVTLSLSTRWCARSAGARPIWSCRFPCAFLFGSFLGFVLFVLLHFGFVLFFFLHQDQVAAWPFGRCPWEQWFSCQELIFVKFGGGDKYQLCLCQELISLLCSLSFVMEQKYENQYRKKGQSTTFCQELIGEIDQDGNGSISFNEFVWLMTRFVFVFVFTCSWQCL